jgi:hypothetical protein
MTAMFRIKMSDLVPELKRIAESEAREQEARKLDRQFEATTIETKLKMIWDKLDIILIELDKLMSKEMK